jgi:hypothetical protein
MPVKQTYFNVSIIDDYEGCKQAVYIDPSVLARIKNGETVATNAFQGLGKNHTIPQLASPPDNVFYIPAITQHLTVLDATVLFREGIGIPIPAPDQNNQVNVSFEPAARSIVPVLLSFENGDPLTIVHVDPAPPART